VPVNVYLSTLGCKLNLAETEALARRLLAAGHGVVDQLAEADVHIVNSCTVTATAGAESRRAIRRSRREAPAVRTVLAGCYVSGAPEEAAALPEADLVVGNEHKHRLPELLEARFPELPVPLPPELPTPYLRLPHGHARATVKIGDGCNFRCAFCIIPETRGRERSRPASEIVAEVEGLVAAGYREIVLTGVQISDWKGPGQTLPDLVELLLAQTAVERLRLTSIAPWELDPRLLPLLREPRVCRHLHLSLQSGSTATLRRMRRPYSAERYAELVAELVEAVPGLGLTTDVIVGFPGETEIEHEASLAFVAAQPLAKIHVFPYSPRPGTAAASLPGRVEGAELQRRKAAWLEVAARAEARFAASFVGRQVAVLWETRQGAEWQGHADNYLRVMTASAAAARNTLTVTQIVSSEGGLARGEVVGTWTPSLCSFSV
jgi:threonylcarbamoyladenosine tRNA methylthiotransferase MtaB